MRFTDCSAFQSCDTQIGNDDDEKDEIAADAAPGTGNGPSFLSVPIDESTEEDEKEDSEDMIADQDNDPSPSVIALF